MDEEEDNSDKDSEDECDWDNDFEGCCYPRYGEEACDAFTACIMDEGGEEFCLELVKELFGLEEDQSGDED